ncbi:MAG: catechol 2,3-dioxygenase-like lactoylglutathione lyase family enzyme [Myxococcota bacterium]|mgnify:CR=1 FL=1|jgi:catechol 2,3-dioxygenase-like lactoylglutathione lyase family enzyme
MQLGTFSVSLAVKDLNASQVFYEALGFDRLGGDPAMGYLIVQNGTTTIGLFQGMFEGNILTFNPGWSHDAKAVKGFTDVRELQGQLKVKGIELTTEAPEDGEGPASFSLVDPDGNIILVDQHLPRP